jgi:hypothetical protein
VATTLAGVQAYLAEGNPVVYLLGPIEVGSGANALTIGANQNLVVTDYTDLAARGVTTGSVDSITVLASGWLSNNGGLKFLARTSFSAAANATISAASGHAIEFAGDVAISEATFTALATGGAVIDIGGAGEIELSPGANYADLNAANAFRNATTTVAALALTADTVKGDDNVAVTGRVAIARTAWCADRGAEDLRGGC